MAVLVPHNFETVSPSEADAVLARESSRRLATFKLGRKSSIRIQVLDDGEEADGPDVRAELAKAREECCGPEDGREEDEED